MKETGIIFNGDMVRATLAGCKTQTRRIVKPQPDEDGLARLSGGPWMDTSERVYRCPFGEVGDRLWVRETSGLQIRRDGLGGTGEFRVYRASNPDAIRYKTASGEIAPIKWIPSIHMPRHASRILLEITDVRVERLNDISQEDAQAEGMELTGWRPTYADPDSGGEVCTPYDNFAELWQSIYGAESWQSNPWVWAITFKRIERD
ncbi:morphogenetic protein [Pectobacterium sp. CHL-2024]|uniref:morphogenetic protein n=1 Tax=Pectobacterium sp. CHL-2024 TaxID=3377079 RepID=UPI0038294FE4